MASTSHGLSVWANTCVKNPINPKTGLSKTLQDRNTVEVRFDDALNEVQNGRILHATAKNVNEKLHAVTEDEFLFYDKLQQLKDENKKTLEAYERLYREKILLEGIRTSQSFEYQADRSGVDREIDSGMTGLSITGIGKGVASEQREYVVKKPPPGKPKGSPSDAPVLSKTLPQKSVHSLRKGRPGSAPAGGRSRSLDREDWSRAFDGEAYDDTDFVIPMDDNVSEYEKALAKVDKLWEDFKITEYTQRRHSFSSSPRKSKSEDEKAKKSEWRHRVTIPQPFNMSIREALKEKKRTTAQEELEQKRLEKQRAEEAECAKKFKAQPVPSHVYLPKYEEIMEKNEMRRKYVKQYCQELLQSQVKPFNFEIREQEKKIQRAQSAPVKRPEKPKNGFKAKPPPKHIFSPEIDEKLQEEEELRKIRVKMRSRELLRESSLPPNMAMREKLKEQERKEKAKMAKIAAKKQKRPRSAHPVPNYDALYREFQKELARRKAVKEGTVTEPFELETNRIRSSRERIRQDIEEDERRLAESRWPFTGSRGTPRSSLKYLGALSDSLDAIPTHSTRAADLRSTLVKRERERSSHREKEAEEAERRRKQRETKLRRYLSEKTNSDEMPKPRDSIAERLKRIKKEDRERQEAYQRDLQEMKSRVEQQPLLVEKFMAENARKEAEKKFANTMRSAGLDDKEFVSARGSRPASVRSGGHHSDHYEGSQDYDDHSPRHSGSGDLTYTKSGSGDED